MSKEIKGSIDYTIKIQESGEWTIEYEQGIENEIVALSISQHTMEHSIAALTIEKKRAKGVELKSIKTQIAKYTDARMGIKMLADLLCNHYESYKKYREDHAKAMNTAEVTQADQEVLKNTMKNDGSK